MNLRRLLNSNVMRLLLLIGIATSLALGLVSKSNTSGAQPYGVFRGRIVDAHDNIIRGASVSIEGPNYARAVKPNPAGHFGIELPVGVYKITVTKSGFATDQLINVDIRAGGYASYVFRLERLNQQSAIRTLGLLVDGDA